MLWALEGAAAAESKHVQLAKTTFLRAKVVFFCNAYVIPEGKLVREVYMESKQESKSSRILIIALLIVFAVLAGCIAAYYYTFHGYKKQVPPVAPSAIVLIVQK